MKQEHGGNMAGRGLMDFSVNLNPLGMPESVRRAVIASAESWERYPDPDCRELTEKLSEREGVPPGNIVCGNGAADLIYRFVHAFKPKKAVICAPTFGEYPKALAEAGSEIREHFLAEEDGFGLTYRILDELDGGVDTLILCSPNNPTGRLVPPDLLKRIAETCLRRGITLFCDECFIGFAENGGERSLKRFMNEKCIVLKAFTKLYAMAGLRLGYALCGSAETAEKLRRSGQYWSVSSAAQAAGKAALSECGFAEKTVSLISAERRFLLDSLDDLGFKTFSSEANFLLFKGGKGLDDRLLREGFLIRNCDSYSGLGEGFFRIAVRGHSENEKLINALGRCR